MNIRRQIEVEAQGTVGYSEAVNKESFMTGVSVALLKAEKHYEEKLKDAQIDIEFYKARWEETRGELETLASIIIQYSNRD